MNKEVVVIICPDVLKNHIFMMRLRSEIMK